MPFHLYVRTAKKKGPAGGCQAALWIIGGQQITGDTNLESKISQYILKLTGNQ